MVKVERFSPVSGMLKGTGSGNAVENKGIPRSIVSPEIRYHPRSNVLLRSEAEYAFWSGYHRDTMRILKPATVVIGAADVVLIGSKLLGYPLI